ncbi:methionine biosynthesis protein MetW [Sessilibacter sp. MAH2]
MRIDLDIIANWVSPNSRVLDLGCGDGTLLAQLTQDKSIFGYGLEIDEDHINQCIDKDVNVIEHDLDERSLQNFADASFDTVIMTQALQTMRYPDLLLNEMLRIGKECIVTFPNFGHWRARLYLALQGKMPVSDFLPYEWYNTPNIHFCTFKDFEILCRQKNIKVLHRQVVTDNSIDQFGSQVLPNLFGETAIYHLS